VEKASKVLARDREMLLNRSAHVSGEGETALRTLVQVRAAAHQEARKYRQLQDEVSKLHSIGAACLGSFARDERAVVMAQVSIPKEGAAAAATARHAEAATQASEQRLAAERAILREEIIKTEAAGAHAFAALQELQAEFKALEQNLITEVHGIDSKMNLTKVHNSAVSKSLADNHGVQADDLSRKHAIQVRLSTLQQQVSPVVYSALHAENDAYEIELHHAVELLAKSTSAEALATVAAEQLEAEVGAQQSAVEATEKALQEARDEGQKQLQSAVSEAAVGQTNAQKVSKQAEEVLATKCKDKWESIKSDKEEEVQRCRRQKDKLSIVQAQRDTLEQALQAQQAADAAGI